MMLDMQSQWRDQTVALDHGGEDRRGREERKAEETPVNRFAAHPSGFEGTHFLAYDLPALPHPAAGTATAAELRDSSACATIQNPPPHSQVDALRARDARVALLAKRSENLATTEDNARFEILTHRLRRLEPRVTDDNLDVLSGMVDDLEKAKDSLEKIRAKFGLR